MRSAEACIHLDRTTGWRRGETGTHLGKAEGGLLCDEREVAYDREAEAEAERVALNLRDADQWRGPQGGICQVMEDCIPLSSDK